MASAAGSRAAEAAGRRSWPRRPRRLPSDWSGRRGARVCGRRPPSRPAADRHADRARRRPSYWPRLGVEKAGNDAAVSVGGWGG